MIRIKNVGVVGIARAVYSSRNAMNSWENSDSDLENDILGEKDLKLAKRLVKAGTDHRKFMRMIVVYADITAPLYWWKEFSTYKVGTVANSCSTMHKIHEKSFEMYDFSTEHLNGTARIVMEDSIIPTLNYYRVMFNDSHNKEDWWQMIQLLPSSYNQKRTVMLNYEVLSNMYKARKVHRLDEWQDFCKWVESLPYSELITGGR